jgi:hypothetical protein
MRQKRMVARGVVMYKYAAWLAGCNQDGHAARRCEGFLISALTRLTRDLVQWQSC